MTVLTIPTLSAVALCLFLAVFVRRALPGRDIPGPVMARYTRLWYIWQMIKGDFQYTNMKLHRDHGKIVRIAPGWYSLNDIDALKSIYAHGSRFIKSEWYEAWNFSPDPQDHNLFSVRNTAHHSDARRKVASMYSMSAVVSYEPYVNDCIRRFCAQLDSFAKAGSMVDLGHWLQCFAFDTISGITYGERIGFLDQGQDINNLMANLEKNFLFSSLTGLMLWLRPVVLFLGKFFASSDTLFVRRFTDQKFTELSQKGDQKPSTETLPMIQRFLHAQRDEEKGLTDRYIKVSAASNIGAGSDTTAIGLSAAVFYLYRSPDKLAKLRQELDDAFIEGDPSFPETQKLPYLQAVIKESMRLHPGVGFPLFRLVPRGGAVICNKFFPEGTNVGINSWVMHRDEKIWGGDADNFVPERWLSNNTETLRMMEQCLMPFGLGSRVCVGKNISLFEINKLIPPLVLNYDIEIQQRDGKDMKARNMWFVKPVQFQGTIRSRPGRSSL
ncbi:cytochrome P450 [Aspergillus sclerotioniger CBS 115572]|uniref:Cytochrome P450 n=1 Tax=Aspergillus sclerotioniger CBS 115572 TaxID=1450535 RepID=A0A317VKT4_9EURO|nr:cytochrome P450 [Aspergillus sclerotioniger CBS 115572]PWY74505.1 cytochrome P450 [Aspergillus sclerotioniger CBS 115572]